MSSSVYGIPWRSRGARTGRTRARVARRLLGLALCAGPLAAGTIRYESDTNRIVVCDFPESRPATLDDVLAADRQEGWGRIAYDPASETYTVRASLWIGSSRDRGTFFQIGRPDRCRETLVLHGDLTVAPPRPSGMRSDGRFQISNRLTLGDPGREDIRPAIRMACSRPNEWAVRVLAADAPATNRPIGEWFMFHAALTPAPDAAHRYTTSLILSHAGVNYRLLNSYIAGWSGELVSAAYTPYDIWPADDERVARGMTFEEAGTPRLFQYADCVFRHLDTVLTHGGAVRCVFENNRQNLALFPNHMGAVLLDCAIGPATAPLRLPRSKRDVNALRAGGSTRHARDQRVVDNPGVLDQISLPVRVVDAEGRPVFGAAVWLTCPADPDGPAVVRELAVTDRDGCTPGIGHERALVLVRREWRPTDDPAAPAERTYRYRLRVEAPGYVPLELEVDGAADLPRPLVVVVAASR